MPRHCLNLESSLKLPPEPSTSVSPLLTLPSPFHQLQACSRSTSSCTASSSKLEEARLTHWLTRDAAALLGPWAGLPSPDHRSLDAPSSPYENKHSQPSVQQVRDGPAQMRQGLARSMRSLVLLWMVRKILTSPSRSSSSALDSNTHRAKWWS